MERKKAAETLIRFTSLHCSSAPHWVMLSCQNPKPEVSGSRDRKSRYCWRTKKALLKLCARTGLGPDTASLELMVSVAVWVAPSVVPTAFDSVSVTVSGASAKASSDTKTVNDLLVS